MTLPALNPQRLAQGGLDGAHAAAEIAALVLRPAVRRLSGRLEIHQDGKCHLPIAACATRDIGDVLNRGHR